MLFILKSANGTGDRRDKNDINDISYLIVLHGSVLMEGKTKGKE